MAYQLANNGIQWQPEPQEQVGMAARQRFRRSRRVIRSRICPYCNYTNFFREDICLHILMHCPRSPYMTLNGLLSPRNPRQQVPVLVPLPIPGHARLPYPLPLPPFGYPVAWARTFVSPLGSWITELGSLGAQQLHGVHEQVHGNMARGFSRMHVGHERTCTGEIVNRPPAVLGRDDVVQQGVPSAQSEIDLELKLGLPGNNRL